MYFATFDPLLRVYRNSPITYRRFMDAPPYRFGRIGFSLLRVSSRSATGNGCRRSWCG